jgi:hypothetical protein
MHAGSILAHNNNFSGEITVENRRGFWKTPALESRQNRIALGRPANDFFRSEPDAPISGRTGLCVAGQPAIGVATGIANPARKRPLHYTRTIEIEQIKPSLVE